MVQSHTLSPAPQAVTPSERDAWRKDILAAAFQGGVTSDYWLEALLDRVEAGR
ncbi:hypothetical protein RAZWK3B_07949 [Roseobacter sp. AzwK-3b]|uniref:hypothetical protein n=1 Tax=Roseobacter sp. AzwK-3b TaxID=351016 RepID=UPI000156A2CD|nr:hypothetical protein [Roseobacter sp. AzwK-3b]EDM69727.1 hypothetical protein RAZWK3B_07949 [Roseobacter sp. AzwK-3b]